ncbi:MAG TPA: Fic family protein [Tepidisphaeraceae bacterium]
MKSLEGNWAFEPDPLPPDFSWTTSLVATLSAADNALGLLAGLGLRLPNPQRLVRMFLRREAELSSRIENTYARVQTMLLFDQIPAIEREAPSVREVDNNFRALEFALQSAQRRRLTRSLIREMHQILLTGVRGHDQTPGQFRKVQAHIGRSRNIAEARFVPCPPHAIEPAMEALESYLQRRDDLPPLVRAAIVHYQFETIHPFVDGNGRVGRVLLLLQLVRENVLPAPLLNPSAQLERHRREYYDRLLDVSQRGDWTAWIAFFARSITEEAIDAAKRVERLESLREKYLTMVRTKRASVLFQPLIDELFVEPSITGKRASELLGIRPSNAQKLLDKLVDVKILREVTGQQRGRVYLAQGIVDLFSTDPIRKDN